MTMLEREHPCRQHLQSCSAAELSATMPDGNDGGEHMSMTELDSSQIEESFKQEGNEHSIKVSVMQTATCAT